MTNGHDSKERQEIISKLTDNLVKSAVSIMPDDCDPKIREKISNEVSERLQFEANVTLNEIVTKYCPNRPIEEKKERMFERFGKNFRYQHMLMIVSVIILIITGMPLKFPELGISKFVIITMLGGLENSTYLHRIGAIGLIIVGLWHLFYTFFTKVGWRDFVLMIPGPKDIKDAFNTIMYYIGRRSVPPKGRRFTFIEKFDYWAVYWGMIIMIGSGAIMWYKEMFPKLAFDIAREAHSDEGLLATLAIVIWHFYNVHFNPSVFPMSWVWWHGQLTETEMKHHHALEYAEIIEKESQQIRAESSSENDQEAEK